MVAVVVARLVGGEWPALDRFGASTEYPALPIVAYWLANLVSTGSARRSGWRRLPPTDPGTATPSGSDQLRRQRRPRRLALTTPTKGIPRSSRKVPRTGAGYRPPIRLTMKGPALLFRAFSTSSGP